MIKIQILLIIFAVLFLTERGFSQSNNYQLPTIIHPSPAAQNFMRYGEIPVDYSTGVPGISVPLYTVTSRKLSLPIGISYHASGIKVSDKASNIGLGWVLNTGGLIAVTTMGNASDGVTKPTYTTIAPFVAERYALKDDLDAFRSFGSLIENELRTTDWQSDRYFYQLPNGQSGIFRYDYSTDQLIKIPYSPVKIEKIVTQLPASTFPVITAFEVTDETGITYSYHLRDNWDGSYPNWDLTRILSADKTDTIRLVYKTSMNSYVTMSATSVMEFGDFFYTDPHAPNQLLYNPAYVFNNFVNPSPRSSESILDSIISSNTVVKFYSAADRQDQGASPAPHRITQLTIFDRHSRQQIRSCSFDQSYFGSQPANNLRLKLNGLSITGSDATAVEKYKFDYENMELPPYPENIPGSPDRFAEDHWGYYNGKGGNSLIPYQFVPDSIMGPHSGRFAKVYPGSKGNRDPDHNYAKACMIKSLQYPTGGKTVFEFEPNRAIAHENTQFGFIEAGNVGGFRIRKITNLGASDEVIAYKTFEYDIESARTRVIKKDLYLYSQRMFEENYHVIRQTITSSPLLPLKCENGPAVFYGKVTEYNGGPFEANTGKTVYTYRAPSEEFHAPFTPPVVDSLLNSDPLGHFYEGMRYQDALELDQGNYTPRLASKTNYKNVNGEYIRIDSTVNTYASFLPEKYYTGIQVSQATTYNDAVWDDYRWCASVPGYVCYVDTYQYPFYLYPIEMSATQEVSVPVETRMYNFSPDGLHAMMTRTTYDYGSLASYAYGQRAHLQPTQQTLTDSRGDVTKAESKYPSDFSSAVVGGSSNVYDQMVGHNIITPVIQQRTLKNDTFLESKTTNYQQLNANSFLPQSIQSLQAGMTNPDTRIVFKKYDSYGNVTELQKANDVVHVYLWGYNGSRPVAEIIGSDYSTVSGLVNLNMLENAGNYSDQQLRDELSKIRVAFAASGKNASVTTYTYDPLVGMTSQTDQNGRITFYHYDAYNRLQFIKDNDGNIVKTFAYHYKDGINASH